MFVLKASKMLWHPKNPLATDFYDFPVRRIIKPLRKSFIFTQKYVKFSRTTLSLAVQARDYHQRVIGLEYFMTADGYIR
jgi:hypothetical protein